MSLPYRPHITWLILEGQTDEAIYRFYDGVQFARPAYEYLAALRDDLNQNFRLPSSTRRNLSKGVYTEEDEKLWERLGYRELYLKRMNKCAGQLLEDWATVGRVLNHPVMRVALDCASIARLTSLELSEVLPQTFQIPLTESAVDLYKRYFLALEKMHRGDWIYFLKQLQKDAYSYTRYHAALTKPQDDVMHLVGLPGKSQYTDFLKNVLATADFKFRHYARHVTPEGEAEARKWAKLGVEAGERHKKFESKDQTDLLRHIQTEFEYVDQQIPLASPELISQMMPNVDNNSKALESPKTPNAPEPTQEVNLNLGI